tara:strand:+ start:233 stop:691 length:459 start_codon:yes stop_codon:yes gene_type:complete
MQVNDKQPKSSESFITKKLLVEIEGKTVFFPHGVASKVGFEIDSEETLNKIRAFLRRSFIFNIVVFSIGAQAAVLRMGTVVPILVLIPFYAYFYLKRVKHLTHGLKQVKRSRSQSDVVNDLNSAFNVKKFLKIYIAVISFAVLLGILITLME